MQRLSGELVTALRSFLQECSTFLAVSCLPKRYPEIVQCVRFAGCDGSTEKFDFVGGTALHPIEVRQRDEHVDTSFINVAFEEFNRLVNLIDFQPAVYETLEPSGRPTCLQVIDVSTERRLISGKEKKYISGFGIQAVTVKTEKGRVKIASGPQSLEKLIQAVRSGM